MALVSLPSMITILSTSVFLPNPTTSTVTAVTSRKLYLVTRWLKPNNMIVTEWNEVIVLVVEAELKDRSGTIRDHPALFVSRVEVMEEHPPMVSIQVGKDKDNGAEVYI